MRLLLAFLLMGAVLFLTPYFYKPAPPPKQAAPAPAKMEAPAAPAKSGPAKSAAPPLPGQISAAKEEEVPVETELYRIRFSNRGAVVTSWVLKKYLDDAGKPLELVNEKAAAKVGYPLLLLAKDQFIAQDALFAVKRTPDGLGLDFEFSDGRQYARKSFRFRADSYLSEVTTELRVGASAVPHLLSWRGGFGDSGVLNASVMQHSLHYDVAQAKLVVNEAKVAKEGPVSSTGSFSFAGIEDLYFAAVALPAADETVEIRTYSDSVPGGPEAKETPHVGVGIGGGPLNRFTLFVGPKDVDLLRQLNPKLVQLVDFGWFAFIAKPLFLSVKWVNAKLVANYGWAIVIVTVAINFLLLPLKISGMKSMKKMQALAPQIAAINEKYKGISLKDPRKTQQNEELMALYKKHGVNPLGGGCLPMILQIPFFFAFYKVLTVAIELRGAPWLWVTDLSRPETLPIRILPIAMIVTQFILQKMTPATTADPMQRRMMLFMPLVLGFMFYSVSSGLVLYWLTGNVVGILQQWFFNKMTSAPAVAETKAKAKAPVKRSSRK